MHIATCNICYFTIGKYRGLINSRNTTQKFSTSLGKPSKWFPNVDFCGPSDVWENFADYHASVLSGKQKGKYLIYDCSSGYDCGGYGNRIHGITALLILAMLTKRVFLIQMTNPTDINTFLQPNAIQWNYTLPEELKSYNINLYRKKNFYSNFRTLENALLGNDEYDVLRVRINSGLFFILVAMSDHMTDNMISTFILKTQYDLVLLYGCAYNYLFKYQPTVIQSINSLKTELGLETGKYVALHVRSFIDEGWILNPFNLKFPFKPMFECALMAANSLSRKMNASKVPIFFTTDHPSIIEFAKDNYNDVLVFSRAPMFHIDHTKFNGAKANSQYNSGTIGVLSDVEICSRATVLIRSAASTLSEVMGAIHFFSPQNNLHPYYFYENISLCHDHPL